MPENPLCPNCGRTMAVARTIPAQGEDPEAHVFQCDLCQVSFITDDHVPVSGPPEN